MVTSLSVTHSKCLAGVPLDLMQARPGFLHGADNIAAGQMVAHMGYLGHAPFLAAVQLIHLAGG